jgi:serine/threonine protein phosphatase PrpC
MYNKLNAGGCFDHSATDEELRARVKSVYLDVDAKLSAHLRVQSSRKKRKPGSCCTAVWLLGTRLIVSHVGDSRVVMVSNNGTPTELASDHHPDVPTERARVEARGGDIVYRGCWRVHSPQVFNFLT